MAETLPDTDDRGLPAAASNCLDIMTFDAERSVGG